VRLAVVALSALTAAAGILHYRSQRTQYVGQREAELASILELKTGQIAQWRRERTADARFLSESAAFGELVERYRQRPAASGADAVARFLSTILASHEYVRLGFFDPDGRPFLEIGAEGEPPLSHPAAEVRERARADVVTLGDLHREGGSHPMPVDLWVPLHGGAAGRHAVGVLLLEIDPRVFLFPLLQAWPLPSASGETLMVRRDGDDVLYLNELRHRAGAALSLRLPLARTDLPAAKAVLGGPGVGWGVDYRGERVLAAWRPIEGTQWRMVCKVDWAEVGAPLRLQYLYVTLIVVAVTVSVGLAGIVFSWSQRARMQRIVDRVTGEREALDARLHEREEELRAFFDSDVIGTLVGDVRGGIAAANDEFLRIVERTRADLEAGAIRWDEITPPEFLPADAAGIAEARQRGVCTPYEKQYLRPDGSRVWVIVGFVLIGERRERSVAFILDVSRHKAAEDEIRRLNETLEERVRSRTAELEHANRELEAFSYSVSHDLRAPLRAIEGFTRILDEEHGGGLDPEARRLLDRVRENGRTMDRLIEDLLALSRAARREMRVAEVNMAALFRSTWEQLAAGSDRPAPRIVIGELPRVPGDEPMLRLAVTNLLDNAIKFSSRVPAPRVEVEGALEAGEAVYRVRDNGVGFDARGADRLFDVFQRLHDDEDYPGTGVGLAIVQRIIARHGGSIRGEGEPGRGAVFSFRLPRTAPER